MWGWKHDKRVKESGFGGATPRRNIMKMGILLGSAGLAKVYETRAQAATLVSSTAAVRCFLKGTKILAADGERKIEDLAIGDLLPAMFGAGCVPLNGSAAILSGRAIRRSHGRRT
jgi:hypothetical protein